MPTKPPIKPERRRPDPRIDELSARLDHVHKCLEARTSALETLVEENTKIVKDMRDILTAFRITGAVAQWVAGVSAALGAVYVWMRGWKQ